MPAASNPRRILALDLGKSRIGAAVSDPLGITAQPLETIRVKSLHGALAQIRELAARHEIGTILVGMPYNMDGTEGEQARWVRKVADKLAHQITNAEIIYWDERLTTTASESVLLESGMRREKRREQRDKLAAMILLQSYLEFKRRA